MKTLSVIITRPDGDDFAVRVREAGFEPILAPLFSLEAITNDPEEPRISAQLPNYSWIIFSSRHGARFFLEKFGSMLSGKIAAIGKTTDSEIERCYGRRADFCGSGASSEDFISEFLPQIDSFQRVLVASSVERRGIIEKALSGRCAQCDVLPVYRHLRRAPEVSLAQKIALIPSDAQLWTFFSPSAFHYATESFFEWQMPGDRAKIFSIGRTTSAAIEAAGCTVTAQAATPDEQGMIDALCAWRESAA